MSIIQFMQQEQGQQTGMIWDYVSPSRLSLCSRNRSMFSGTLQNSRANRRISSLTSGVICQSPGLCKSGLKGVIPKLE